MFGVWDHSQYCLYTHRDGKRNRYTLTFIANPEERAYNGLNRELCPQWGPRAKPLVGGRGSGRSPSHLKLKVSASGAKGFAPSPEA